MLKKQLKYIALWSFLIGLFVIVLIQVISGQNINRLVQSNQSLLNELKIQNDLRKLEVNLLTIESDLRGGIITHNKERLQHIETKVSSIHSEVAALDSLISTKNTVSDIKTLNFLVQEKIEFSLQVLKTFYTKGKNAAEMMVNTNRGMTVRDSIVQVITKLDGSRRSQLQQLIGSIQKSGTQARAWGFILAIIASLFIALAFWYIIDQSRQQHRMILALNESEKNFKDAAQVKEQFMANMSHEIRTPMNAILGFTNLLQRTPLNEQQKHYVDYIQSSSENLLTLINDILDLSKIEAGMMHLEEAPFSLSGLLNSIETMFQDKAKQNNLKLSVSIQPDTPDTLQGDAVRLTQILMNLLSNAIKFTNEGGITITVQTLTKTQSNAVIQFRVKDTGIGIAPEKQQQIFERFRQAEADTTRRYGGTGLGLSIVRQIVELQKGTITVISKEGEGSEFIVTLPYKIATVNTITPIKHIEPLHYTIKNIKILIAEDNEMNQQLIKHLMKHWQLEYKLVQTGHEVLEALSKESFSLVLMDVQMPEMDGYTATINIRDKLKLNIPIIAMTAHALAGEKEKCLSYGMNDYISKPIKETELYTIIKKYTTEMEDKGTESVIDLEYLKDLSKGDTEFEHAIVRQFIVQVPEELELLQEAIHTNNLQKIKSLAHGMKSSVGYMGLTSKLQEPLQRMEAEAVSNGAEPHFQQDMDQVKHICNLAVAEAEKLLNQIYA